MMARQRPAVLSTERSVLSTCLLVLTCCLGCSSASRDSVQLTLISPHRDEIREEVALGFKDWFRQRTVTHLEQLRKAVESSEPSAVSPTATAAAETLLRDWTDQDLPEIRQAYGAWKQQPGMETQRQLLTAVETYRTQPPVIDVVWLDIGAGTSQIERYIRARFDSNPDGIGIDLLFGGGTDIYIRAADRGHLQRIELPAPLIKRLRPQLNGVPIYDKEGRWYGPVLSSFGILYNREVLQRIYQPEPKLWKDLGEPGLMGWVSSGDPRMTGSIHMVYEIILQGLGWQEGYSLLMRMGANTHGFIRDSGTLSRTVTNGQVAAAGNLDANALTAIGRNPEMIGFVLPEGQTIINPDAIGVLKGAPHSQLARAFVEFTLSDAGQLLFLLRPGQPGGPRRYPLCRLSSVEELYERYPPEVRSIGTANPFKVKNTIAYNTKLGGSRWDALNDLMGATILDAQPELAAAWSAVVYQAPLERRVQLAVDLFQPPVGEQELLTYSRRVAEEGARLRTLTINQWGEDARERYRRIRQAAAGSQ